MTELDIADWMKQHGCDADRANLCAQHILKIEKRPWTSHEINRMTVQIWNKIPNKPEGSWDYLSCIMNAIKIFKTPKQQHFHRRGSR
jgi:hypothetical protein